MEIEHSKGGGFAAVEAETPPHRPPEHADGSPRFDSSRALRLLEEMGTRINEESVMVMPTLLSFLRHSDPWVVRQAIACGTVLFAGVLEEIAFQLDTSGKVDGWLEELWSWMVQFKDAIPGILAESGSVAIKLVAVKFLENCALLLTPQSDSRKGREGKEQSFDISLLSRNHPRFDPSILESDSTRAVALLISLLRSAYSLRGALTVTIVNCLASIGKRRPFHYDHILSALLAFDPNVNSSKGAHSSSIRYSLRAVFLGFLRSSHPSVIESRDRLTRALRALSPGEATEQAIRQVEKLSRNNNIRLTKDDELNGRKRAAPSDVIPSKRARPDISQNQSQSQSQNADVTPAGKMLAMIGALMAEGERGAEPLKLLISNIHADLMADIVLETMKRLPKSLPTAATNLNSNLNSSQDVQIPSGIGLNFTLGDGGSATGEVKRDPRRDPRRLDPRRTPVPSSLSSAPAYAEMTNLEPPPVPPIIANGLSSAPSLSVVKAVEKEPEPQVLKQTVKEETSSYTTGTQLVPREGMDTLNDSRESISKFPLLTFVDQEAEESEPSDLIAAEAVDTDIVESDQTMKDSTIEDTSTSQDLPIFPVNLELNPEERKSMRKMAVKRIIDSYEGKGADSRLQLLARLVAQDDTQDEILEMLQKNIVDYSCNWGHELAMHVLYHLQAVNISILPQDSSNSSAMSRYEKFLISLAKALIDALPSADKSFSRLLGEAPYLPNSVFGLIEDLCFSPDKIRQERETEGSGDRVTQGLGTVWSLILGRPPARQSCLDIALKCAVHSQDEVRSKAIRLVANKLYLLSYASERIEQFATNTLMSVAHQQTLETDADFSSPNESKLEAASQETSVSNSQNSESDSIRMDVVSPNPSTASISLSDAQCKISLFFALCSKKPSLIRLVFDVYGKAPKAVKQAIHRHIPSLVRTLGSSCPEILNVIHNLPEGSENLINLVLQVLTEESIPSAELIASVKNLYHTKLKDPVILIPMLSSLSKEEVLPIFPRLIDLPLDKFQAALARILQGSAHTGPALTPSEVLIAIHDINPERDGVALKKVTDACTACFEQRMVFTQQVLAKSLNQMVEKTPLPLLFMRTVIQTVDAFPALVNFIMEILSKLVSKQVWRMPKLWPGFLKCAYQTQPHSFTVLLELPPPLLENVLNKYQNLRAPLAAHVVNKGLHSTLPMQSLKALGLVTEPQQVGPRPLVPNSSLHESTLT